MATMIVKEKNGKDCIPIIKYYTISFIYSIQYPIEPFKGIVLKNKKRYASQLSYSFLSDIAK